MPVTWSVGIQPVDIPTLLDLLLGYLYGADRRDISTVPVEKGEGDEGE